MELTLRACGKINLYLNVKKGYREDGYHEIKSIMQSIGLWDELHFVVSRKTNANKKHSKLECCNLECFTDFGESGDDKSGTDKGITEGVISGKTNGEKREMLKKSNAGSEGVDNDSKVINRGDSSREQNGIYITSKNVEIPLDEKNLVHKAALLVMQTFGLLGSYEININIIKHIPVCAGLGGGSADAAATIVALNELFGLNMKEEEMLCLASEVGADVPFCISGGTALAEGKGEKISKLPNLPFYWIVLAYNGKKFLSKDVYEKFDLVGREKEAIHHKLVESIIQRKYEEFFSCLENSLEEVVVKEDDKIRLLEETALGAGAIFAQMTGSGPTVFAVCEDLRQAKKVCESLKGLANGVFLSHTISRSLEFV
ncbi:MAG: 4-(cytidine 5'-diphospho)-2-C-methyl-D-erythritol kinase [Actinobacteria bacterium]|nr:4-(cytidine 5'-diphospho)-2-C-methyl-D-erythritol kinase [Actinomycetota bacterium]